MKLTKQQVLEASRTTTSASQAAKKLGIKVDTYKKYALQYGCYKTNQSGKGLHKKRSHRAGYEVNDTYFDTIDTYEKAYILGFIAADGTVANKSLRFYINRKDRTILEFICDALSYDKSHINDYSSHYTSNGEKRKFDASSLNLSSSHMITSLKKYNIIPNKSHVDIDLFKNIPLKYKVAWLIGYIDGDGYIGNNYYRLEIVSNYNTIISIQTFLKNVYNVEGTLKKIGDITYTLNYSKKDDVAKLLVMYTFGANNHLQRKYNRATALLLRYARVNQYTNNVLYKSGEININTNDKETCIDCGKIINKKFQRCKECEKIRKENESSKPCRDILKQEIRTIPFTQIGKKYGVSDNAVRKWCKYYKLPFKTSVIKKYTDVEWEFI